MKIDALDVLYLMLAYLAFAIATIGVRNLW